jgi:beta-phosphoglucomutase-like phosphatase (HAD superfamily)
LKKLVIDPRAKGLIFDLDGTIADTMPIHFLAYRNILKEFGVDFTPALFKTLAGIPAIGTIVRINEIFGTRLDPETFGRLKEAEYEKVMVKMEPVKPVVDLIREYYGKLPMAVGTGGYTRLAWKSLEILDLKKYFNILVSSEDVENHKPFPDTFLKCAQLMGVEPRFCQVFEDGRLGIEAALSAGMMAVDVTDYYQVSIGKEL